MAGHAALLEASCRMLLVGSSRKGEHQVVQEVEAIIAERGQTPDVLKELRMVVKCGRERGELEEKERRTIEPRTNQQDASSLPVSSHSSVFGEEEGHSEDFVFARDELRTLRRAAKGEGEEGGGGGGGAVYKG